ncbi:hypothetical protein NDU88_002269 [Pleurodeles waltl]|uniref:Uncharacterized protein n=1 Tax=Pleurodeles waltl TaxID=8319 RepID=A0AAV7T1K0_PLEWA|nr:hypothetical protein NDU88_002269 [Pleurodeles waltl]
MRTGGRDRRGDLEAECTCGVSRTGEQRRRRGGAPLGGEQDAERLPGPCSAAEWSEPRLEPDCLLAWRNLL